jgi:hypothetical protein
MRGGPTISRYCLYVGFNLLEIYNEIVLRIIRKKAFNIDAMLKLAKGQLNRVTITGFPKK